MPSRAGSRSREVLLAYDRDGEAANSLRVADDVFRPGGLTVCRAHTGLDAIERVEQGGLAAAVVWGDPQRIDGLSVLRVIRSIDVQLPCWFVTREATRQTMEAALALKVRSVMAHPIGARDLVRALRSVLIDPGGLD